MELRRVTSAVVRSHGSPLTSLLNPSSTSRWASGSQLSYRIPITCSSRRNFNSTTARNAARPTATTTAPSPGDSQTTNVNKSASNLGWTARSRPLPSGVLDQGQEKRFNGGGSADSVLAAVNSAMKNSGTQSASDLFSNMQNPRQAGSLSFFRDGDLMSSVDKGISSRPPLPPRVLLDLKPHSGRMVTIDGNIDVGRGFRLLEQSCARNKVRSDFTKQRFHERGGLKRKRLRRERWRKKFMEGFRATVGRVKQLRNQGW